MSCLYVEVEDYQTSKKPKMPCGDVFVVERTKSATTIFLSDGMGSGIKANIAATMCIARLKELTHRGFSIRKAVSSVVQTMMDAIPDSLPYAVFTIVQIQNDGYTTILTYDMPPPIMISHNFSTILEQKKYVDGKAIIHEANCFLNPNEAIVIMSDGVTQSGMGTAKYPMGWGIENVNKYINDMLNKREALSNLPNLLFLQSYLNSGETNGDDITAILAMTRRGITANILTGPPRTVGKNHETVNYFLDLPGSKIVCGATTAKIVAEELNQEIVIPENIHDSISPPSSAIEGIDLVTEGLITLNQLYNIIDEDRIEMDDSNPVTQLYDYVMKADRVNFIVGMAENPANRNIMYKQMGLMPRKKIVKLLTEKLEQFGKLVTVTEM